MSKLYIALLATVACTPMALAGEAGGSYQESGAKFNIGYAIAERAPDGTVRILLTRQEPAKSEDWEHHLKRLDALGEAAEGGYLILEPTPDGDGFNITISVEEIGGGGGGQYASEIQVGSERVGGTIDTEVLSGQLKVKFDAEYLPERKVVGDLPADGGEAGAAVEAQMKAVASGDRDQILATLTQKQRDMFAKMSPEEQKQALADTAEFAPKNVRATGGVLYDGYAIVKFDAEDLGEKIVGTALVSKEGGHWRVGEVSMTVP